jgi:hypothetical protein
MKYRVITGANDAHASSGLHMGNSADHKAAPAGGGQNSVIAELY